jgi:hypothetical protein
MGALVFFLRQIPSFGVADSRARLLALIGSGTVAYVVALLASGGIERREMAFLRNMVQERLVRGGAK